MDCPRLLYFVFPEPVRRAIFAPYSSLFLLIKNSFLFSYTALQERMLGRESFFLI